MATVKEIQVCGGKVFTSLLEACQEYVDQVKKGVDREKLHFAITLPGGKVKTITIRQEDDKVIAYGDFEGLPSFLEWALNIVK